MMTFFLLNEGQAELARKRLNQVDFRHGEGAWRYAYANSPDSVIAFDEKHVLEMLRSRELELSEPIWYGTCTGARWRSLLSRHAVSKKAGSDGFARIHKSLSTMFDALQPLVELW